MSKLHQNVQIQENKPDHHYRTEIPNIVFEMGLDPFQLSVYCNLKRIAGDSGSCWYSKKALSKICGMGETKLKECINFLSNLPTPLIKIIPRKKPDGSPDSNIILITDVWRENGSHFRNNNSKKSDIGGAQDEGGVGRKTGEGGSPNDHKEEPSKKELKKEKNTQEKSAPPPVCPAKAGEREQATEEILEIVKDGALPFEKKDIVSLCKKYDPDFVREKLLMYYKLYTKKRKNADIPIAWLKDALKNNYTKQPRDA